MSHDEEHFDDHHYCRRKIEQLQRYVRNLGRERNARQLRAETLEKCLNERTNALSFLTAAIDPAQGEETDEWELTDIRWRIRVGEFHAKIKRLNLELSAWKEAVTRTRARYPTDVFPESGETPDSIGARFARGLCDTIREEADEAIEAEKDE